MRTFKYKDKVVINLNTHNRNGECGEIIKFIPSAFDDNYNYTIEFSDGTTDVFLNEEVKPLLQRIK